MFSHDGNSDDHGVHHANATRAHTRWQHIAASHEATNMLHQVMCLVLHLPGGMVVTIAAVFDTFYYIAAVKLNYLQVFFYNLIKLLQSYPHPAPLEEVTHIRYHAVGGANGTTMVVMFVELLC